MSSSANQPKFYYGWVIVGVTFLLGATEAGAFQNVLSVFIKPMTEAFGWSRTAISATMMFGSISGGFVSSFIGPVLDRHGSRMVAFVSVLILSLGLVSLAFMDHIWQLYLFFGVGRMLAVGVLSLVISVSVSNWFIRQRGRAMGIAWLGPRVGSAMLPILVQYFILSEGWRFAWAALGIAVFVLSGVPALIFLKRRPEDVGLMPDGDAPAAPRPERKEPGAEDDGSGSEAGQACALNDPVWTRKQALHTRAFWQLICVSSIFPLIQAGTNFHLYPFITDQGIPESVGIMLISTFALSGTVGALFCGFLAERFGSKPLLVVNGFASGACFLSFFLTVTYGGHEGGWLALLFVLQALNGIMHGGRMPLLSIIWADYFGRKSLGSIQSLSAPFRFTTNATGPILTALCYDFMGSYAVPFYSFIVLYAVAGVVSLYMTEPKAPQEPEQTAPPV